MANEIDKARTALMVAVQGHTGNATFTRYIESELAGDFAVELAAMLAIADSAAPFHALADRVQRRIDACCVAANTPGADYFDASTSLIIAARELLAALPGRSAAQQ